MLNQILNRLTSTGTAQARRGTSRSTGRRAATTRRGTSGVRRGVRGRGTRQAAPQTIVGRLLGRR